MTTSIGVTLLSGGLDSTTVTVYAQQHVDRLTAVTFNYDQNHSKEVECARAIAEKLGIKHRMIDIGFLKQTAWYSALTNPEAFPIPKDNPNNKIGTSIPITYVPLRNTIFVSMAGALIESEVLHAIEAEGVAASDVTAHLYMAPNAVDYSGYPDCRPEFFQHISETLRYGSKLGTEYGVKIQIETPIIQMSKSEIVEMGVRLGAPLEHTWSCYEGYEIPCGHCDSCRLRARGFLEAGISDPLLDPLREVE